MIKAMIDSTRLPLENPSGKSLRIYLYRLLLVISVAFVSFILLLLFTFAMSSDFRQSVFLPQSLAPEKITDIQTQESLVEDTLDPQQIKELVQNLEKQKAQHYVEIMQLEDEMQQLSYRNYNKQSKRQE